MKAIVLNRYGSTEVLELKEVGRPVLRDDHVLVCVIAASINADDHASRRCCMLPVLAR